MLMLSTAFTNPHFAYAYGDGDNDSGGDRDNDSDGGHGLLLLVAIGLGTYWGVRSWDKDDHDVEEIDDEAVSRVNFYIDYDNDNDNENISENIITGISLKF